MDTAQERSLVEWLDHVLAEYHLPLAGEISNLDGLTAAIAAARPNVQAWVRLRDDLLAHIAKEERVLFPWIRSGRGATAGTPIQVMTMEHGDAQQVMAALGDEARAALATGDGPARRWAEAYLAFDVRLREHMRIEEQELFPRALVGG